MKYLMTFWTTTAAFRAEKAMQEHAANFAFELVAVPLELAETCHGYGLLLTLGTAGQMEEAENILREAGVKWKAEWEMSDPYKKINGGEEA